LSNPDLRRLRDNDLTAGGHRLRRNPKESAMNIRLNRLLDALVCIAILAIGLTLGGATAVLGA
jgi:hypothetical protein